MGSNQEKSKAEGGDKSGLLPAVNAAGEHLGGLILSAIAVYVYVALAVASTTQEDLLVGKWVSLPLIQTPIPLGSFSRVAPLLVLVLHAYVLLNARLVFEKVSRLGEVGKHSSFLQWHGFVALMMRDGYLGRLGRLFFYFIGTLAPLAVLIFIEVKFLRFRSISQTIWQCLVVLVDASLVTSASFWKSDNEGKPRLPWRWLPLAFGVVAALFSVAFIGALAKPDPSSTFKLFRLATLDLPEAHFLKDEPEGSKLNEFVVLADGLLRYGTGADLRERDLSYAHLPQAIFVNADLRNANFSGADLSDADFRRTKLGGAKFDGARLDGARFDASSGENVSFDHASLMGTHLSGVLLRNARFRDADLTRAEIHWSLFEGGNFDLANLEVVSIIGSEFKRTSFIGAQVPGGTIWKSVFRGVNISLARFNQANLQGSWLEASSGESNGAWFDAARLQAVVADNLNGVSLRVAKINKDTRLGEISVADLRGISFEGADEREVWRKPYAEALKGRDAFITSMGQRQGDWLVKGPIQKTGGWAEIEKERRYATEWRFVCGKGCVRAFDSETIVAGLVRKQDTPSDVEEVQRSVLAESLRHFGEDLKSEDQATTATLRRALLRELWNCFSPSRDPRWEKNQRWLTGDLQTALGHFLRSEAEDSKKEPICPWWQHNESLR